MPDVTLRIKNLSISLEAISRVNSPRSSELYAQIESLLWEEIRTANEENEHTIRSTHTSIDDNTPF